MQLRHLECFLAVAEELHFSRAARRLHLSQPPLSRHIKELEDELGVTLFRRSRREVALTEAGAAYQQRISGIFRQLTQAGEEARRIDQGELGSLSIGFVGALTYEFLPPMLRSFREARPGIHVTLHDLSPAEQCEALELRRIDVGFVGILPDEPGPELAHRVVKRDLIVVALPEGHPLAQCKKVALRSLAQEPWVMMERKVAPSYERFLERLCAGAGFVPRVGQECGRAQAMLGLVAAGLGVTLVPETLAKLAMPGVVYRSLKERSVFEHAMVWRAEERSPLVRAFLTEWRKWKDTGA